MLPGFDSLLGKGNQVQAPSSATSRSGDLSSGFDFTNFGAFNPPAFQAASSIPIIAIAAAAVAVAWLMRR